MVWESVLCAAACVFAGVAGASASRGVLLRWEERRRRADLRSAAGVLEQVDDARLASGGIDGAVLRYALKLERDLRFKATSPIASKLRLGGLRADWFAVHARRAGLRERMGLAAFNEARIRICAICALAGVLVGALISNMLALVLGIAGAVAGFGAPVRAITREEALRADALERELPEMLEVMSLGLSSGLTFDRSLALYCTHFDTAFARECASAQQRWNLGFATREQALRDLAATYDSALLNRVVEAVVRSLRFGSSLAENFEAAAAEARAIHKAHREEEVAKAPVKMMVPTGALILPAMLLLVLGPVLLELMEGI